LSRCDVLGQPSISTLTAGKPSLLDEYFVIRHLCSGMRAMVLDRPGQPLQLRDGPKPKPGRGQLLVRVAACAVCRTDLHIVDGELPEPKLPLILGHQIVGRLEEIGPGVN